MQIVSLEQALFLVGSLRQERQNLCGTNLPPIPPDSDIIKKCQTTPHFHTIKNPAGGPEENWAQIVLFERSGKTAHGRAIAFYTGGLCLYYPNQRTHNSGIPVIQRWTKAADGTHRLQPLLGSPQARVLTGETGQETTIAPPDWVKHAYGRPLYVSKTRGYEPRFINTTFATRSDYHYRTTSWDNVFEIYRAARNLPLDTVWPQFHTLSAEQQNNCVNAWGLDGENATPALSLMLIKHLETGQTLDPNKTLGELADTLNLWTLRTGNTTPGNSVWTSLITTITKHNSAAAGPWTEAAMRLPNTTLTIQAYFEHVAQTACDIPAIFDNLPPPSATAGIGTKINAQFLTTIPVSFFTEITWRQILNTVQPSSTKLDATPLPWTLPENIEAALEQLNRPDILDSPALIHLWLKAI